MLGAVGMPPLHVLPGRSPSPDDGRPMALMCDSMVAGFHVRRTPSTGRTASTGRTRTASEGSMASKGRAEKEARDAAPAAAAEADPASMLRQLHAQVDAALNRHRQELQRCFEAVTRGGTPTSHQVCAFPRSPANHGGQPRAPLWSLSPRAIQENLTPPSGAPVNLPGMTGEAGGGSTMCSSSNPATRNGFFPPEEGDGGQPSTGGCQGEGAPKKHSGAPRLQKTVSSSLGSETKGAKRRTSFQESMQRSLGEGGMLTPNSPASAHERYAWLKGGKASQSSSLAVAARLPRGFSLGRSDNTRERATAKRKLATSSVWRFTQKPVYQLTRAVMMVLDVAIMIYEAEAAALEVLNQEFDPRTGIRDTTHVVVIVDALCVFFLVDLALRFIAYQCDFCLRITGGRLFTTYVACTYLAQLYAYHGAPHERSYSGTRVTVGFLCLFRVLRLLQIVQVTTFIRTHSWFRELRIMVFSLVRGVRCLIWSVLIVLVLLMSFGLFFTEGTLTYLIRNDLVGAVSTRAIRQSFGTLDRSMLTLFQAMTGGRNWGETFDTLATLGLVYQLVYVAFVTSALLGVLNMVTAVTVETTIQRSQNDRDLVAQSELDAKKEFLATMEIIFRELDTNDSSEMEIEELTDRMQDPTIAAYFSKIGVDVEQVQKLFKLLDQDKSGSIDKDEFMYGCLRLHGQAKSFDIAIIQHDMRTIWKYIVALGESLGVWMDDQVQIRATKSSTTSRSQTSASLVDDPPAVGAQSPGIASECGDIPPLLVDATVTEVCADDAST